MTLVGIIAASAFSAALGAAGYFVWWLNTRPIEQDTNGTGADL